MRYEVGGLRQPTLALDLAPREAVAAEVCGWVTLLTLFMRSKPIKWDEWGSSKKWNR